MNFEKPLVLSNNRKTDVRIVASDFSRAAEILQSYLKKITGGDFVIQSQRDFRCNLVLRKWEDAPHRDGFRYYIYDKDLFFEAPMPRPLFSPSMIFWSRSAAAATTPPPRSTCPLTAT